MCLNADVGLSPVPSQKRVKEEPMDKIMSSKRSKKSHRKNSKSMEKNESDLVRLGELLGIQTEIPSGCAAITYLQLTFDSMGNLIDQKKTCEPSKPNINNQNSESRLDKSPPRSDIVLKVCYPKLLRSQDDSTQNKSGVTSISRSTLNDPIESTIGLSNALEEIKAAASKMDPTNICRLVSKSHHRLGDVFTGELLHVSVENSPVKVSLGFTDLRTGGLNPSVIHMLRAMRGIRHPNLSCFYENFMPDRNTFWIMCEKSEGKILNNMCRSCNIPEQHIATIGREVCKGLRHLHSNFIVHRNVTVSSVYVKSTGEVKLSGFQRCMKLASDQDKCWGITGSLCLLAPEMLAGDGYGTKVDIWSLGLTILEIVDYRDPFFNCSDPAEVLRVITTNKLPKLDPLHSSGAFRDFLSKCLCIDPGQRASAADLLSHEFLTSAGPVKSLISYTQATP